MVSPRFGMGGERLSPLCALLFGVGSFVGGAINQPVFGADLVLDWNSTLRSVVQHDGAQPVTRANPGWSTRAMAMTNGAIYDAFQAIHRTHSPYLFGAQASSGTSLDAAVHQAAFEVLSSVYPGESALLNADYAARMALVANGPGKTSGMALGSQIAQAYIADRSTDHSGDMVLYVPQNGPGKWRPLPGQTAWGPEWRSVTPFAIGSASSFVAALPPIPALASPEYADAFNMVKDFGSVNSVVRTTDETEMALFWAYDRPTMGPPPVLFNRNLDEIATQAGNSPEENARLFALASVAMADAAIAAWDAKFEQNFWRPVAAIQEADTDGNAATLQDVAWQPLGAPGDDPNSTSDDFTPPFPGWTSGHATMGGALFKAIELFYGTNEFDAIDGLSGDDAYYTLTSQEFGANGSLGMARNYTTFAHTGSLAVGSENSPDGENGMSRVYLGIHFVFDQQDGITLGHSVAEFVAANQFLAVPEPSVLGLASILICLAAKRRERA